MSILVEMYELPKKSMTDGSEIQEIDIQSFRRFYKGY